MVSKIMVSNKKRTQGPFFNGLLSELGELFFNRNIL